MARTDRGSTRRCDTHAKAASPRRVICSPSNVSSVTPADSIPVIFCFDVEPDEFFIDPGRREPWPGFEATFAFAERMRPRWEALTGRAARFNWFLRLDPQIAHTYGDAAWVLRHYERQFAVLQSRGDELGIHPHGYRWDAADGAWVLDYGNQPWMEHCVQSSAEHFARVLGRPCRAYRGGDRWNNQATAALVRRLGITYDLTLEPGFDEEPLHFPGERVTGTVPDMRRVPIMPFQPRADDYQQGVADGANGAGGADGTNGGNGSAAWTIPISTARINPGLMRRVYYRFRYPGRQFAMWTALFSHHPAMFERIVASVLARPRPHLAIPMRTNAMADRRTAPRVEANLETLLRTFRSRAAAVVTPAEAISLLS
jgi:hypothetical protein